MRCANTKCFDSVPHGLRRARARGLNGDVGWAATAMPCPPPRWQSAGAPMCSWHDRLLQGCAWNLRLKRRRQSYSLAAAVASRPSALAQVTRHRRLAPSPTMPQKSDPIADWTLFGNTGDRRQAELNTTIHR